MSGSLTDGYGQSIPYLDYTDKPDLKSLGEGIVGGLTPRSVMRFTDANSRGATITSPVAGMVTYLTTEDRYDGFTTGQGWVPLTPGPWNPLPYASGMQAFGGTPGYRLWDNQIELRGQVSQVSGAAFSSNGSTGYVLATLPVGDRPSYSPQMIGATELAVNYYCRIGIDATTGNITAYVPQNSSNTWPHWVGLDNLTFSLT